MVSDKLKLEIIVTLVVKFILLFLLWFLFFQVENPESPGPQQIEKSIFGTHRTVSVNQRDQRTLFKELQHGHRYRR